MDNDFELTIIQVIKKYGLLENKKHSKSLGQHFLCDNSLLDKIVSCALPFGNSTLVEIGPGPCGLTRSIIKFAKGNEIICIEKDESLKPVHENIKRNTVADVKFIYGDALKIKLKDLTAKKITIISNLPYNVGTKILLNWFCELNKINQMVLMFQKEVAERIYAKEGTKDYGRLSVISQLLCDVEKCFDVSRLAFIPPPKVESTVIKLIPKADRPFDIRNLERLTAICFQHRRKTIFSILKKIYPDIISKVLNACAIDPLSRPENISPQKFWELSETMTKLFI